MKHSYFLIIFLFLISFINVFGQVELSGKVINTKTLKPIPFANIGILNSEVGTISNIDGTFSLFIPQKHLSDSLLFSSLGFKMFSIHIASISDVSNVRIKLDEKITDLNTIEVIGSKEKDKSVELGNGRSLLLSGQLHYDTLSAGSAMALLIKKTDLNLNFIQQASLYIAKNLSTKFKIRLRIMSVDSLTQKPDKDLINEQVIQTSNIKKGWVDFPINEPHEIEADSFFLVFEWIVDQDARNEIADKYAEYMQMYPDRITYDTVNINNEKVTIPKISKVLAGTVFGVTNSKRDLENFVCYYRSNSFGEWKLSSGILSAKVILANQPSFYKKSKDLEEADLIDINEKIDNWAKKFKSKYNVTGLQLSVSQGELNLFSGGYGFSDIELEKEVNSKTQFRIASISKTMTSAAIMQLYSKGFIDIDLTIQTYVPEFPLKKYPITVRQLAGHLGGIRHYYGESWDEIFIQEHYNSLTDALILFKDDPLEEKPGNKFLYSSFGYILLGAAIENISDQTYLKYMKKNVWGPLNMNFTYGEVMDSVMINKSKFYFFSGQEAIPYDLSYSYSTGGLVSTTDDLVRFGYVIMGDDFLNKGIKQQMFQNQLEANEKATGYGLGWYLAQDSNGENIWYHTGELPSSSSLLVLYPDKNIAIALLSNSPIISNSEHGFIPDIQALSKIIFDN